MFKFQRIPSKAHKGGYRLSIGGQRQILVLKNDAAKAGYFILLDDGKKNVCDYVCETRTLLQAFHAGRLIATGLTA
jgi:hypothetical protein